MTHTMIIDNREFSCQSLNAIEQVRLHVKIKKFIAPFLDNQKSDDVIGLIMETVDDAVLDEIVMPLFKKARVYDIESKTFLDSEISVNKSFAGANVCAFYELIYEVFKYNLSPLFDELGKRFGGQIDEMNRQKAAAN